MTRIMIRTPKGRRSPATARLLSAAALLVLGGIGATTPACVTDNPPGGDCLKDEDCESRHCVQLQCIAPGTGQPPLSVDGGGADASSDAPTDAGSDTGSPADTGTGSDAPGG